MGGIGIHGFGRIGRLALRVAWDRELFTPVSVSDIQPLQALAPVLQLDSNYGLWQRTVGTRGMAFLVDGGEVPFHDTTEQLPDWGSLGVDTVIDCTSLATTRSGAQTHLDRGARRVLVSAPSSSRQDCDAVLLPGINLDQFDPHTDRIVSMASCTTNGLAPMIKTLREVVGIETGFFASVHAYTSNNQLVDGVGRKRRDSWAAPRNIIPAASGAATALQYIWPDLAVTGKAYRVPVSTGSIVELTAVVARATDPDELRDCFRAASRSPSLAGIMDVLEEEWPSSRIIGESHSCLVDLPLIQVQNDRLVSVPAWYDNEMGYVHRLVETAAWLSAGDT